MLRVSVISLHVFQIDPRTLQNYREHSGVVVLRFNADIIDYLLVPGDHTLVVQLWHGRKKKHWHRCDA